MTNILSKLAVAAVAALASTTLVSASAMAAPIAVKSAEVSFSDLDLTSRAGAAALHRRVNAAARKVCEFGDERNLMARAESEACRAQALAQAEPQIDAAIKRAQVRLAATVNSSVARP